MKRNSDWTDEMRSKLRDAELTPPGDGWERLRQELARAESGAASPSPPVSQSSPASPASPASPVAEAPRGSVVRLRWRRIAAAAAAVLFCVVAGELLWRTGGEPEGEGTVIAAAGGDRNAEDTPEGSARQHESMREFAPAQPRLQQPVPPQARSSQDLLSVRSPQTPSSRANSSQTASSQPGSLQVPAVSGTGKTAAPGEPARSSAGQMSADALPAQPRAPQSQQEAEHSSEARSNAYEASRAVPVEATRNASRAQSGNSSAAESRPQHASQPHREPFSRPSVFSDGNFVAHVPSRKKAAFGLFAGGGVTGGNTGGVQAPGMLMSDVAFSGDGQVTSLKRPDYGKESYRHHQPLSFGLSVRKEFAHGLSLESGVIYTLLRSDVRLRYSSEDIGQRLHFIGVPLRLNWKFLERGGFSLYIGAGGMAEKCVSAELGSRSVNETAVQWSVLGAAGAEYRFGGPVGLYFEPEVSYYFTETSLPTARTDAPLTVTLRLGVRLSF